MESAAPLPNPLAALAPELLGQLASFRDRVVDLVFDQLAAVTLKDNAFRAGPRQHPPEDARASALLLRVLAKPQWDDGDLRIFDAYWQIATRSDLFAEAFEAERDRIAQLVAAARAQQTAQSWVGKVAPSAPRKGTKRLTAPKKAPVIPPSPTPAASGAPQPPIRCLTADAGNDTVVVLIEDAARGQLQIVFEQPDGQPRLAGPVQAFLRENGFEADPAGGGCLWGRPLNVASTFQDRIDGEYVVFRAAEMMQTSKKSRRD